MSNDMNKTVREFYKAVEGVKSKKTGGYDVQAIVRRVEDGVAWVHIPDGVDETPARLTINAKEGDVVQVRVVNGRAFLVGNASAPPTDNTEAIKALSQADVAAQAAAIARLRADEATTDAARAHEAADAAQQSADDAAQAASDAQDSADAASDALQSVVTGATTVEKAVSVMQTALEAVVDYDPTTDTTKEYFWHDANGAHVLGADSGYRNDVDSSGMKIVNVSTEKTAAEFGANGAQIGETGKSHVSIDYHSLQLVDRNNNTYMHVSDLRDADGYASYVDTFTGDGSTTTFYLSVVPTINADHPMTVYVDDVETSVGGAMNIITFPTAPADGAAIRVTYYTTSTVAKAYTFGSRRTGNIGAMSFSEGSDNIAGGHASHAEGQYNAASGHWSHAEGEYTTASGAYSHAEGNGTEAQGWYSHAGGDHTIAYDDCQTAIGKYNKDDTSAYLLFSVGNGSGDNSRSNAFTVDVDGNATVSADLNANNFIAKGHDSEIGYTEGQVSGSNKSIPGANTWITVCSFVLSPGVWLVSGKIQYPVADPQTTSYVRLGIKLETDTAEDISDQRASIAAAQTMVKSHRLVSLSASRGVMLRASAGVARTCSGWMTAIRLQ